MKNSLKTLFLSSLLALTLGACSGGGSNNKNPVPPINSDTLYAKKIENLNDDFFMGMDVSSLIAEEQSGVKYYDFEGNEQDLLKILHDNGINLIRVRVWNDPYDSEGHGYGGGNNDIDKAVEIGKRATKYGMKLLVDFHYSDFWADPSKQFAPKGWENFSHFDRYYAIEEFTKTSLQKLKDAGVDVGMVQIGNETSGGRMAGYNGERPDYFCAYINAAAGAIKEVYPQALKAVHFTNPEATKNYLDWAEKLNKYKTDYDVFGTSYYPYWHGTLDNLQNVLNTIAETYNKKVMVLETSYCFNTENTDFYNNTIGEGSDVYKPFPFTVAGQANSVSSIIEVMSKISDHRGIGVCYWEGAWITVGTNSYDENFAKWEQYGSGWASSYAGSYDPKDAGQWYGGCSVENQAFFDKTGHPLESLKVWGLVRKGNTDVPKYIDGVSDTMVTFNTDDDIALPETVDVVYNDNSKSAIGVTWESFDIEAARKAGNGDYVINGVAADEAKTKVKCFLSIREPNYIANCSFDEDDMSMWKVTNNSSTDFNPNYYKAEPTGENPKTGAKAFAWWGKNANSVNFDLEQELSIKNSGTYKYQASFTGGTGDAADPEQQNLYIYVKINDVIAYKQSVTVTKWSFWFDAKLPEVTINAGDKVVAGIHIESSEAGFWGAIDDCLFNFVG